MLKKIKKTLKDQRGLTLIELLAVIVILGIIAAIAIPSIGGIINKTKEDAKVAEGIQIISAAKMYTSAHKVSESEVLDSDDLEPYLDSVDSDTYKVTVTGVSGKYTYSLTVHPSVDLVDGKGTGGEVDKTATETELQSY